MSNPVLYQIAARDWLWRCGLGASQLTLAQIPDSELDCLAELQFNWLYLLGVWQTGAAGVAISRSEQSWRASFEEALPDLKEIDITGSPFAITAYRVHEDFGGNPALAALRERLSARGIKLMLDFVPNHTALDHPWVSEHPDYFLAGTEQDLVAAPANFARVSTEGIFAHGRDPYFSGWPDTLQLNYSNPAVPRAMTAELEKISALCDGLRCDMAMLLLPEIFEKTWSLKADDFWRPAISAVRQTERDFLFLAEVYWGLQETLQQHGFDYTYDKELLDRLLERNASHVQEHLSETCSYQGRCAHFLENHDEPRIAALLLPPVHKPAALLTYLGPGMAFFHDGQLQGYTRKPSNHLAHRALETTNAGLAGFYGDLLRLLPSVRQGEWRLLETLPAWEGNPTATDFLCYGWIETGQLRHLIAVNYADHRSQCYAQLPRGSVSDRMTLLRDQTSSVVYNRQGAELQERGLYLDLAAWEYNVFRLEPTGW